jgi:DNA/RNA endonuclease YhcR with UshA esterase domain
MKNSRIWASICALIVTTALAVPAAIAQQGMRRAWGVPRYNPSTEATVRGTVEEVRQVAGRRGRAGTHLTLKTDEGTLDVHLGPSNFLKGKKFAVAKGDQVEVVGSKVQYQGHDALLAREVKKGNETLTLRNAQGIPEWSRGARRY